MVKPSGRVCNEPIRNQIWTIPPRRPDEQLSRPEGSRASARNLSLHSERWILRYVANLLL